MNLITAKTRITIGLVCLSLSVLLAAIFIGIVPDRRSAVRDGRAKLCEAIAVNSSILVSQRDLRRLEAALKAVVQRNDDILSAAVRRSDGQLVVEVGEHARHWTRRSDDRSIDAQIQVPLWSGQQRWGTVEMRFVPLRRPGMAGLWHDPMTRLVAFIGSASFLVFLLYLRKVLQHLDPSKAVPKRVRHALDTLAEGLLVIDRQERIVLANQAFASWVGLSAERLVGRRASTLPWSFDASVDPDERYPWVLAIQREMPQTGVMMELVDQQIGKRTLMVNASPVLGHDGRYRGVLVSFDDVTQLETTKRELHKSKEAAEQANRAKSEFLARMSHEIRTPMNAILGYTDVLRRGFDESVADRQQYLDTIHASGEHLLALINDILDLSKIESGRLQLEQQRTSPYQILSQVISVLQVRAEEKGIQLRMECPTGVPETIVTDPVRLRQTIMNLVGNAIKFTDQGSVRVVARLVNDRRKPQLAIDVIDTGIGIAPEALEKIFDPFAQADTSITRRFGGTGLGLAISRQLAEAMGGGISVTSQPGQGSTFTVTVDTGPLDGVPILDIDAAKAAAARTSQQTKQSVQLPPARILVADDGESNRKLMQLVLRRTGVTVETAEDGQQAVEKARRGNYDLILMDMQMPVLDGYAATRQLRQEGCKLPIIALTAHAMQGDEQKCRDAGCTGFLTKPIDIDRLLASLAQTLAEHGHSVLPAGASPHTASAPSPAGPPPSTTAPAASAAPAEKPVAAPAPAAPVGQAASDGPPLVSSLPTEDPDFLEIVIEFKERLDEKLQAMRQAWQQGQMDALAQLAHWLKGSGGTAGFDAFTAPARQLEQQAKAGQQEEIGATLVHLESLAARIQIDASEPSCT